jgi:hypothetical protein
MRILLEIETELPFKDTKRQWPLGIVEFDPETLHGNIEVG